MQEKLIVFINANDMTQPGWAVVDGANVVKSHYSGFALQLVEEAKNREVIVIVPGEEVLLTSVSLPKMSRARLHQAIPYALEEQLTQDVEQMHFAVGEYVPDGRTPVAVVAKSKMQEWSDWFKVVNIVPDVVLPQMLALPHGETVWYAQVEDVASVRTGGASGFVCDRYNLKEMLMLALEESKPEEIVLETCGDTRFQLDLPVKVTVTQMQAEKMLDQLAVNAASEQPINLLQVSYRSRKSGRLPKMTNLLKVAGCLFALWLFMLFSYPVVSYFILSQHMHSVQDQIVAIYKRQFPDAASVIAPRQRIQQKLHKLSSSISDNPFLLMIANIGKGLNQAEGIQLKRMDYQNGLMTIEISAASSDSFAALNDALERQGLRVREQNADLNGTRVNATLRIE